MPQSKAESLSIGDVTYDVGKLDPFDATDLFLDLIKIIAPSLAPMAAKAVIKKGGMKNLLESIGEEQAAEISATFQESMERGLLGMVDRVDKQFMRSTMVMLSKVTTVNLPNGKSPMLEGPMFDKQFKGELGLMFKWFGFALKVQYASFLPSGGISIESVLAAAAA